MGPHPEPPRVALDVTPLLGARTGVGAFVAGLVDSLAGRPDLALSAYGMTLRGRGALAGALPPTVPVATRPLPAALALRAWARADRPVIEHWTGAVDVVHGTNFVVPPARRAARLVTVYDLTAVHFPELCLPAARRYPDLIRRAVAGGAWIHADSHAVAAECVEHLGADPDRVRVVYPGIDPPVVASRPAPVEGRPYLLALGTVEPRKDLPSLVAAFDAVAGEVGDLDLRIAGPEGWGEEALAQAIAGARHQDRIHRLGWVADRDALLAGATAVAYPSRYEGFGFPPLEAMAHGVPVIASTAGALPEVLGDAALLVAPGDVDALAGALARVVADAALRDELVAAGRIRVARYPWSAAGDAMAALYGEMASAR